MLGKEAIFGLYHVLDAAPGAAEGGMSMIEEIGTMFLWGFITITLLFTESISLEYAYIGMCIMLAAGLLHKEE